MSLPARLRSTGVTVALLALVETESERLVVAWIEARAPIRRRSPCIGGGA